MDDEDGVGAIMELTTSSVALAVQALSRQEEDRHRHRRRDHDLTGKQCSPYGFHWAYDTHSQAVGTGGALVEHGSATWFFITVDYAFGYSLQEQTTKFVEAKGGKVLGRGALPARHGRLFRLPAGGEGLEGAGGSGWPMRGWTPPTAMKGAAEFGIAKGGQKLATLLFTLAEVHGLGLAAAQGAVLTEAYYWDLNDTHARLRQLASSSAPGGCRT